MDFKALCQARYSARAYKPDAIPAEKLEYIKECTRLAPSAVNRQPWKFTLFTSEEDRARLQQCYDREWFREAPAYVLACENRGEAWTRRYDEKNHADIDLAIASSTSALPPPNKAWERAGCATSACSSAKNCSTSRRNGIPWPSFPSATPHRPTCRKRHASPWKRYGKTGKPKRKRPLGHAVVPRGRFLL